MLNIAERESRWFDYLSFLIVQDNSLYHTSAFTGSRPWKGEICILFKLASGRTVNAAVFWVRRYHNIWERQPSASLSEWPVCESQPLCSIHPFRSCCVVKRQVHWCLSDSNALYSSVLPLTINIHSTALPGRTLIIYMGVRCHRTLDWSNKSPPAMKAAGPGNSAFLCCDLIKQSCAT